MPNYTEIVEGAVRGLRGLLPAEKILRGSPLGELAWRALNDIQSGKMVRSGELMQGLIDAGVFSHGWKLQVPENEMGNFVKALEHGTHYASPTLQPKVQATREWFDKIIKDVQNLGGMSTNQNWVVSENSGNLYKSVEREPVGFIKNYFPHYLKKDWADAILFDANKVYKAAAEKTDDWSYFRSGRRSVGEADFQEFTRITDQGMAGGVFDKKTQAALNLLVGRGMSSGEAIVNLRNRAMGQITNPFSVLKHQRSMHLESLGAYEENPVIAITSYLHHAAKHITELEVWGNEYQNWEKIYQGLALDDPLRAKYFKRLSEYVSGTAENLYGSKGWKKFTMGFAQIETATKIGLGTATVPNISQLLISTMPKAGMWKTMRGVVDALRPERIRRAHLSGFINIKNAALHVLAGMPDEYYADSALSKMMHYHPGLRLFNWVNKVNNIISALTGEQYLKDMYGRAQNGSKWAVRQLERYGIDHTVELTDRDLYKGMNRFATDMQLQRDVLKDPLWANDPRFRFLALFKRFGMRQTFNFLENGVMEAAHGNVMPLLRLGAGGVAGGYFVNWAKNAINRGLGGNPSLYSTEDQGFTQQLLYNVAVSGSFGSIGDLVGRHKGETLSDMTDNDIKNVFFQGLPVAYTELAGIPGDYSNRGWLQFARELAVNISKDLNGEEDVDWRESGAAFMKRLSPLTSYKGYALQENVKQEKLVLSQYKKLLNTPKRKFHYQD